ncbi:unnamed protein product [Gadus morhua 'NCC']
MQCDGAVLVDGGAPSDGDYQPELSLRARVRHGGGSAEDLLLRTSTGLLPSACSDARRGRPATYDPLPPSQERLRSPVVSRDGKGTPPRVVSYALHRHSAAPLFLDTSDRVSRPGFQGQ